MSANIALKTVLLLRQICPDVQWTFSFNMIYKNGIIFPYRGISTVLLLLCQTSCPPQQQEQGLPAAVPGLGTTDAKLHCCCCCWCCSPVLLLLWCGHTHAHKNYASDFWVEGIHTTSRDTPRRLQAGPDIYRLTVTERRLWQTQLATYYYSGHRDTSKVLGRPLRRRLSWVSELQKRSLCVSRARHLSACLFHVSASSAIIAAATVNSRRLSQQTPYKTCVSFVELGRTSRNFYSTFRKNPNKKVPEV